MKKIRRFSIQKIFGILGIGENILSGILADIGGVSRGDSMKEIQKLSGSGLVACSSGKHKKTKIGLEHEKVLNLGSFKL